MKKSVQCKATQVLCVDSGMCLLSVGQKEYDDGSVEIAKQKMAGHVKVGCQSSPRVTKSGD